LVDKPHTALAAMTKWYGPHHAGRAVHDCLLLHGNYGYSSELPFEQRMRDVRASRSPTAPRRSRK
jgi:cyclohexanecarboxyl-CoA dehydrogenase